MSSRTSQQPLPVASSKRLIDHALFMITTVLTDNGKEFTDRFCATGKRQPTGAHAVDRICADHRVAHRLPNPEPRRPTA